MKKMAFLYSTLTILALSACATPEQIAAQQERERRAQQELGLRLAAQGDQETADLMRRQAENPAFLTAKETQKDAECYREKISNPLFQSCYQLAWNNYLNQTRLQQAEDWAWRQQMYDDDWLFPRWRCGRFHCR